MIKDKMFSEARYNKCHFCKNKANKVVKLGSLSKSASICDQCITLISYFVKHNLMAGDTQLVRNMRNRLDDIYIRLRKLEQPKEQNK